MIGQYSPEQLEIFINKNYGDRVSWQGKNKDLVKFGSNLDIGTSEETVWIVGGVETLLTTNTIDTVSSSNAGDTQLVVIEGHTVDANGDFTFVVQSVTLTGQTKVVLTTPLARTSRIYNHGISDFAGTVYTYEDGLITLGVPDVAADIHLQSSGNQSLKASSTISKDDYYAVTQLVGTVDRQSASSVNFRFQVALKGKVFRTQYTFNVRNNSGTIVVPLPQPIIISPNSDFRMNAVASAASTPVLCAVHGTLLIKS